MNEHSTSTPATSAISGGRLKYIDAMRGLAILLVVFSHVTNAYVKFPITNNSFAGVYYMMTMFRMPLFFFVSGFFAYRAAQRWDSAMVRRVLTKKFQAQVFGLAVFCIVYAGVMKGWHFNFLWKSNPYWFTESLFMMFCLYLCFALLERRTGKRWPMWTLLGISFVAPLLFDWLTDGYQLTKWANALQVKRTLTYLPYFLLGVFARGNEQTLWKVTDNQYFKALVVVGFLSLVLFYGCRHKYSLQWDLVLTAMRLTGLFTLMVTFRTYRDWFDKGHRIGNVMCKVGSRTLDIYYLHYFFIPNLAFLHGYLYVGRGNNVLAMLTVGLVISALVVALCMLTSAVLRTSPLLARWLFGSASPTPNKFCND